MFLLHAQTTYAYICGCTRNNHQSDLNLNVAAQAIGIIPRQKYQ